MNDRPQIQPDPVRMGEHSSEHSLSGQTIDPASATTVVGDYELLAEIARGGMGVVYQARQRSLDRFVALKLILAGTLADESEVDRFKAEAKAAARLDHPNIVPVYDIGTHERQYFFSMGLVDGLSLAARLKTSGPLPPLFAASLMAKVARAVAYAHDVGVVHRDLKPGNVLLDSADHPWVTDFGLAKRVDESAGLTATGQVMGTPAYMPPEQAAGETDRIGPLADVYSLGATLYAALTGQPPFSGGTIHELLMQVAEDPPRPPSERNPAVTPDLDAVCLRCLAKHPADRYPSAAALAEDLERIAGGQRIAPEESRPRRKRLLLGAVGAVLLGVVAVAVWLGTGGKPDGDPSKGPEDPAPGTTSKADPTPPQVPIVMDLVAASWVATAAPGATVWVDRYPEAARAYEAAFRKHGIDPLGGDVDAVVATFRKQPAEVREVILAALERWELSLTAAKQPGADQLRSVQDAFDLAPWRKQLRLAREDANEAILLQVAAEAAKQPLTGDQAEVVALAVQVSSAAGKPEAIPILRSLRQKQPAAYGVNAALAATLFASKGSSRQEVAAALEASSLARPESPVPHLRLATVYTELKDLVRAKAETERGQEKQYPEASRFLKEAWTLCEMRKFPEAVAVAEKATEAAAGWPLAHATLGIARRRIGKTEAAEAAFRKAVELAPSEAAAIELLRNIFTRDAGPQPPLNRLKEQLYSDRLEAEVLRRVVKFRSDPSLTTLAKLWRCLLGVDQIDERLAICERMFPLAKTEKWKNDLTSAYVSRAAASGRLLRLDTPIVQQLQKLNPLAFDHLGLIAVRNGQPDVAVDTCLAAYAKSKDDWFQKPRALALARHWASGDGSGKSFEKKLRKLQEDDPLDLRPAVMLALNDALADREKEAALALRRTRARFNAPNLPASTALAADFLIMGRLDDAVRVAQLYEFAGTFDSNRKPYDRWGLYFRAFAFLRAGDVRGAESHAQAAYQNSFEHLLAVPRGPLGFWEIAVHTYAASALGRVRFRQGRYREAAEILSDAHGIDPFLVNFDYYPHAQLDLGADYAAALLAAGDLAEASKVARQIVGFRPEKATARQALGQVLLAEGKPTEAAAEFRAAAKLDPFDGHADFHLGRALLNSGDLDGAVKAFEQSIRSYHRRWIRDFASIPEDAAVAVLSALRKKLFESLPADQRKTYQAKAIGWVKNDMAAWRKKAESDVPFEYASAASVLKRLVEVKFDQDRSLVDALPDDLKSEWRDVWKEAETIRHIAAAKREKLPQDPMEWHWPASREREVAEWVLKQGGMVTVVCPTAQGRIHRMDLLPQVPFRIEGVSLSGLSVDDSAIDKLAGLLMLTEVHLDGTKVTDAGIRKLVEVAPLLSRLNIERTKVGDGGLAAVAHLTEVYARRSSVTPGSVAAANNDRFGPKVLHESALAKSNGKKLAGHALRFDGMTAYVELPISYTSGQPITMEATILIEPGMCNRYGRVVECELEHKSGITTFLHMGRESHSAVNVKGAYHWTPRPKSTIPFLERTQIALSFDGTTLRAFVNGKLIGDTKKPEVQRGIQMDRMFLGKQGTHASEHFRGVIDEVRISSTCRYLKDYTPSPKLEADAFTEGLYHMDEGSGESLRDSSGKGRNGRIVNAKWVREEEE